MANGSEQTTRTLPLRIVPRRGQQIGMLAFFAFFFGFSVFWMAGATGVLDPNEGTLSFPPPGGWEGSAFGLFGLPFAAVGFGGMIGAVLKMLPNSPYYHLELASHGLLVQTLFKQQRYDWRELPPFDIVTVEKRTKSGKKISHYAVAMESAAAPSDASPDASYQREIVRIRADDYGANSSREDADAMVAWFNQLRELARSDRLSANETIEVPEGFRATAIGIGMASRSARADSSTPTIRHTDRAQRRPTVERR